MDSWALGTLGVEEEERNEENEENEERKNEGILSEKLAFTIAEHQTFPASDANIEFIYKLFFLGS